MRLTGRSFAISMIIALSAAGPSLAQQPAWEDGRAARAAWESWLRTQVGDRHDGAEWWAGQRSKAATGSCTQTGQSSEWVMGCSEAVTILAPSDVRRRADTLFRAGWNGVSAKPTAVLEINPISESAPIPDPVIPPLDPRWQQDAAGACLNPEMARSRDPLLRLFDTPDAASTAGYKECVRRLGIARQTVQQWKDERDRLIRETEQRRQARRLEIEARARTERAATQERAEKSEDNVCAKPAMARIMLEEFNRLGLPILRGQRAYDIEHVTTTSADQLHFQIACHGSFVVARGLKIVGTLLSRNNIAGDPITEWEPEGISR